jgi:hypothetical protein
MGNCISQNSEDKGFKGLEKQSVGPSKTTIDQGAIDLALSGMNTMDSLKGKVSLAFSAENLPNMDKASKTDPMLVLWQENGTQKKFLG